MGKDLSYFANIPLHETYAPTVEYWRGQAAKAYETSWGLPDKERWLCGLLRAWALASNVDEYQHTLEAALDEITELTTLVSRLSGELEESEGQVRTLRMQLGKAKKKLEKAEA